ncbi:MAG: cytochrome C oxidase subunit IV family protein [Gemmatimonadota bacterium]|nr:cytochrome C oxidase subunit IV family protein [Gemmatimonadota bacterium]
MADHPHAVRDAHGEAHAHEHHHPTWKTYRWVALILTVITIIEVWIYYTPFVEHRLFVPSLLVMSAAKFIIVVMFYMHLKYDAKLFRALFIGPLLVAATTLVVLLFLFGQLRLGV